MTESRRSLDKDAMQGIAGKSFFYPCAWEDWYEPLDAFGALVDEFYFVDVGYRFSDPVRIKNARWTLLPEHSELRGPAIDFMRIKHEGRRTFRDIRPAWLCERYLDAGSGQSVTVIRRRGFGQIALDELPDNSLGIFCHRGDSSTEGGSATWFLANRKASHPPLARLFDKIKRKLAYPALIVSDGSNTSIRQLCAPCFARDGEVSRDTSIDEFDHFGLHWKHVGELNVDAHRRTLVWRVERVQQVALLGGSQLSQATAYVCQ